VVWALLLFDVYLLPVADLLVPGDPFAPGAAADGVVTNHLAAIHTLFNLTNTSLMLPLVNQLARLVTAWVPDRPAKVTSRLIHLSPATIETPEILIVQAGNEMRHMTEVV